MKLMKLKKAIIHDSTEHPERTDATFERVAEVFQNVLGEGALELIESMKREIGNYPDRRPMNPTDADKLVDLVDEFGLEQSELSRIIEQLDYSEISTAEALDLHLKYKIPVSHLEKDIVPVKGDGCWIMDTRGDWYLDMDSNYSATNLGMSNDEIARGLFNQAKLLISMKEDRVQIARTRFLKEVMDMMPEGLENFYWQNSGGEAVDKSIKMAKAHTGTRDVIAFKDGFHGRTHGAVAVTWNEKYRKPFGLDREDWVHFADFNDIESVRKVMDETGSRIVIMEMVQGEEAGNRAADPDFVEDLRKLVDERDGVLIDDEVQAGFGRTALKRGEWFACMSYDVVPDIMVIGKSFGGGYPVTAVVTGEKVASSMKPGYDGSTFGGNPMAMVCTLIATRQMKRMGITENVVSRGKQLREGLESLMDKYDLIDEVRGTGLMLAFSVKTDRNVQKVLEKLAEHGVKLSLSTGKYVRMLPPTIITSGECRFFLDRLDRALSEISSNAS